MDPNMQSPTQDDDVKPAFRKPTTVAANRKYRRHSPVSRSPSDGSPRHDRSASPKLLGEDPGGVHENLSRRKDNGREVDRDSYSSHYGRGSESYRHSDRQFSRNSHRYSRHDDFIKHDRHADDEERYNHRSSRSGRESRGGSHLDHSRSRDHLRDGDRYSRDKYDSSGYRSKERERETSFLEHHKYKDRDSSFDKAGSGKRHPHLQDVEPEREGRAIERDGQDDKRDFHRSSGDYRGDQLLQQEEFKDHRFDSSSKNHAKESYKNEVKGIAEQSSGKSVLGSENQESFSKRQKFSLDKNSDGGKKVSKFSTVADVKEFSPKQPAEHKMTAGSQVNASDFANDVNAAKVAAMKAAELVNKNLVGGVGTGFMTADQKKKLLWGNKKTTTAEEESPSGHHWDTTLFSDRERQEKFNKLMSLRLPWCLWPIVGGEGRSENRSQTRKSRWQRPSSGETEGTPARFREAVHCWAAEKRWPYCWTGSLSICSSKFRSLFLNFLIWSLIISFTCTRIMLLVVGYFCSVKHKLILFSFLAFAKNWILHDIPTVDSRVKFAKFIAMLSVCLQSFFYASHLLYFWHDISRGD